MHVLHMNDYPAQPPRAQINDAARVFPGDGVAPLSLVLRTLHEGGFDGFLSLEVFNRDYWRQDAHLVARTGIQKMRAAVQSALGRGRSQFLTTFGGLISLLVRPTWNRENGGMGFATSVPNPTQARGSRLDAQKRTGLRADRTFSTPEAFLPFGGRQRVVKPAFDLKIRLIVFRVPTCGAGRDRDGCGLPLWPRARADGSQRVWATLKSGESVSS